MVIVTLQMLTVQRRSAWTWPWVLSKINQALGASILAGVPPFYFWLASTWYAMFALMTVVGIRATPIALVLALTCLGLLLLRPAREVPLALLLLSTTMVEELMYIGAASVWIRVVRGELCLDDRLSTKTLLALGFLASVTISVVVGFDPSDFRPWQLAFWALTLLFPMSLLVLRVQRREQPDMGAVFRFGLLLALLQAPILLLQGIPASFHPDSFVGIGGAGTHVVGFWGTTLFAGAAATLTLQREPSWRIGWGLLGAGLLYSKLADAKVYSSAVLAIAVLLIAWNCLKALGSRRSVFFLAIAVGGALATGVITREYWRDMGAWGDELAGSSRKVQFLTRAFSTEAEGYDPLFGAGPGMMGSRAANLVSGDIQFKEKDSGFLPEYWRNNSPAPQRWAMRGLWDEELYLQIRFMSATLVMPFSGIGAMKGELGWSGLILFVSFVIAAGLRALPPPRARVSPLVFGVCYALAGGLISTILIAVFDSVWEIARIIVPLGAIAIAMQSGPLASGTRPARSHGARMRIASR